MRALAVRKLIVVAAVTMAGGAWAAAGDAGLVSLASITGLESPQSFTAQSRVDKQAGAQPDAEARAAEESPNYALALAGLGAVGFLLGRRRGQ